MRGVRTASLLTFAAGGSADRAYTMAKRWARDGAVGALVSFGMAGGLDPALHAGDLVLAARVFAAGGRRFDGDAAWLERVRSHLARAHVGAVEGSSVALAEPATKQALHKRHGALAVDMESHGVAAAAAESGIPFIVLRAIADPSNCPVPAAALAGISERGAVRPMAVAAHLVQRPAELRALFALAGHSRAALAALRSAVRQGALLA